MDYQDIHLISFILNFNMNIMYKKEECTDNCMYIILICLLVPKLNMQLTPLLKLANRIIRQHTTREKKKLYKE